MSGFTDTVLEKKLSELNGSQQSIQTLSLWLIHHRKHHKTIVQVWLKELRKVKPNRKLTYMYLANDVIQNSKKKGPEFTKEFATCLAKAFHAVSSTADEKTLQGLCRILSVWEDRCVYDSTQIEDFKKPILVKSATLQGEIRSQSPAPKKKKKKSRKRATPAPISEPSIIEEPVVEPKRKKSRSESELQDAADESAQTPPGDPPDPEELIKALQELENSASTDAAVREKIACLPPEVSESTLLDNVQDRESAEKLSKLVDEACTLLADYNSRLSQELEDRRLVARMLSDFTHSQRDVLQQSEQKLEEYKDKLRKVTQVRNELKSHLQNLPDLTLLPNVTDGLAPLPSAGDLFSQR